MLVGTESADKYRADGVGEGGEKQRSSVGSSAPFAASASGQDPARSASTSTSPAAVGNKGRRRSTKLGWSEPEGQGGGGDGGAKGGKGQMAPAINPLPSNIPVVAVTDDEEEEVDIEVDVEDYARLLNELNEHSAENVDVFVTSWNAISTALVFYYLMLVPFRLGFQFDPYTDLHNLTGVELFLDVA